MNKFSVVIPTYNSSEYLKSCIYGFKNSLLLDEIIIGDDFSDFNELKTIKKILIEAKQYFSFDIKLLENEVNIGAFKNKYNLIESAKNDWVYQIDSDNIPFSNIDSSIKDIMLRHQSQMFIYYPSTLIQFWKHYKIAEFLSNFQKKYIVRLSKEITYFDIVKTKNAIDEFLNYDTSKDKTKGSPELDSNFVLDKHIYWVLNCGNFVVNKKQFLDAMKDGLVISRDILSMDAVAFSYLWLKNQGTIILHPQLGHYHRKRFSSVSYSEKENSIISRKYFTDKILSIPSFSQ